MEGILVAHLVVINNSNTKKGTMKIDLGKSLIEFYFQHCQVEITGKCNMACEHCRAWEETKVHMPLDLFKKSIDFAISEADSDFRLTISGGEPFLHPGLIEMMKYAKSKCIEDVIITTNGSLVTLGKLKELKDIGFKNLAIQISVDSFNPEEHNKFRNFPNAFELAMKTFDLTKETGINSSLRASITPDRIYQIDGLVDLAIAKGAKRIGIGSVIPAGKGKKNRSLLMNSNQKRIFLEKIAELKVQHPEIDITTEDPLKFALKDCPWEYGDYDISQEDFYGGCSAGISGFNIDSEGIITPCAVLLKNILDLKENTVQESKEIYVKSEIIKNLFKREFFGKCGSCDLKRLCGGCRAVAEGINGNYLGEDTTCFYKPKDD